MCMNGWTVSYYKSNACFSEMSEVPDRVYYVLNVKYLQCLDLRLLNWGKQRFEMM